MESLLHTEEHQHVLPSAVKLLENSTSPGTSRKLPSAGLDTLQCLQGLVLCPKLSQPGSLQDCRSGASKWSTQHPQAVLAPPELWGWNLENLGSVPSSAAHSSCPCRQATESYCALVLPSTSRSKVTAFFLTTILTCLLTLQSFGKGGSMCVSTKSNISDLILADFSRYYCHPNSELLCLYRQLNPLSGASK